MARTSQGASSGRRPTADAAGSRRIRASGLGAVILLTIGLERLANAYLLQPMMDVQVRVGVGLSCVVAGAFLLGLTAVLRGR